MVGTRSRASAAIRLDAPVWCLCEPALAQSELRLFQISHVLFPVYVALLVWGGLFLRERRLRALIPLRLEISR